MGVPKTRLVIVSPALRDANNGNWRTAQRWSRFLRSRFAVDVSMNWTQQRTDAHCMIALHARRSAPALASFADLYPARPRVLVLTGTDLYRDIATDAQARHSLDLATHLVVLQDAAWDALERRHHAKCRVIYQSAPAREPAKPNRRTFDVAFVGHMRPEKDPLTPMRALLRLPADSRVRLITIGDALNDELARAARALQARRWPTISRYRWLGARPHAEARRRISAARALVVSSVIEGGANVIVEAVTSRVPVLASRIPGNVGMLGPDYNGYFMPGDDEGLAALIERASRDAAFLAHLASQCAMRAPLFDPAREEADVNRLVDDALAPRADRMSTGQPAA